MKHQIKAIVFVIVAFLVIAPVVVLAQADVVATNTAASSVVPETLKPIIDLLGAQKGTWITTVIVWFSAISALLAPFAVWIRNKLADALNNAAASSDDIDDDTYLRKLFSNKAYRFVAFVLNFANIRLPKLAELERAIELQKQAVVESKSV